MDEDVFDYLIETIEKIDTVLVKPIEGVSGLEKLIENYVKRKKSFIDLSDNLKTKKIQDAFFNLYATVNEIALYNKLIKMTEVQNVQYEQKLKFTDKKFDFSLILNGDKKVYIEVKTIQAHWISEEEEQKYLANYKRTSLNIDGAIIIEGDRIAQMWHGTFSSHNKFFEYTKEIEKKISESKIKENQNQTIAIFCGNRHDWHISHLEDFVTYYKTKRFEPGDHFRSIIEHNYEEFPFYQNIDNFFAFKRDFTDIEGELFDTKGPSRR